MSQPRAALLRHRPPLPPAFPPSCLPLSPLRRAPAPSKQPRSQAAVAAATPSGGIRGNRAGRSERGRAWAGPRRPSARARRPRWWGPWGMRARVPTSRCVKVAEGGCLRSHSAQLNPLQRSGPLAQPGCAAATGPPQHLPKCGSLLSGAPACGLTRQGTDQTERRGRSEPGGVTAPCSGLWEISARAAPFVGSVPTAARQRGAEAAAECSLENARPVLPVPKKESLRLETLRRRTLFPGLTTEGGLMIASAGARGKNVTDLF